MLCSKLLNACVPESIDERALNVPQQPGNALGDKAATENSMLCLNAAKALGCPLNAVTAEDLAAGQATIPLYLYSTFRRLFVKKSRGDPRCAWNQGYVCVMGYLSPKSVSGNSSSLCRSQAAVEQTLMGWRVAEDGDFPLLFSGCNIFKPGLHHLCPEGGAFHLYLPAATLLKHHAAAQHNFVGWWVAEHGPAVDMSHQVQKFNQMECCAGICKAPPRLSSMQDTVCAVCVCLGLLETAASGALQK